MLSFGAGGYTYLLSGVAIYSFTEALATIFSNCLYKSHLNSYVDSGMHVHKRSILHLIVMFLALHN